MGEINLPYWLHTSAVTFAGTCAMTKKPGSVAVSERTGTAELITRADLVQQAVTVTLDQDAWEKSQFTLSFTDDGRLAGADIEQAGQAGTILASLASVAGVAARVAPMLAMVARPDSEQAAQAGPPTPAELLRQLGAREQELALQLATEPLTSLPLQQLDVALRLVAAEQDRLAQLIAAAEPPATTTTATYSYTVDVAHLPTAEEFLADPDGLPAPLAHVWADLRMMATLPVPDSRGFDRIEAGENGDAPFQPATGGDDPTRRIWYRRPRRTRITIWTQGDDDTEPRAVKVTDVEILDKHCRHFSLPVDEPHLFGHNHATVTMGANGTPTSIGGDHDSGLSDVLTAVAGVPKQFSDALTSTDDAVTAWQKLAPAAPPTPDQLYLAKLRADTDRLKLEAEHLKWRALVPSQTDPNS